MSILKNLKKHSLESLLALGIFAGIGATSPGSSSYIGQNIAFAQDSDENEKPKEVPHYLKNVDCPEDPVVKLFEKWRVYDSLTSKYPTNDGGTTFLNESIIVNTAILGKKVKMTFVGYVKKDDKIFRYANDGIEILSQKEFDVVVKDHIDYITKAATLMHEKFTVPYQKILENVEATLKKEKALGENEKLEDLLDKEIPDYDGLKNRDVLFIPSNNSVKDFIPAHYFFGSIPEALGVTYLGTGIVAIDPKARILDHINGPPAILMHEMVHNNKKLEGFPFALYFDAELWAEFPMLTENDCVNFTYHGYLKDVRKLARVLFDFDSSTNFKDIREYSLMFGGKIEDSENYKKLRRTMEKVNKISEIMQSTALNDIVPEFYTHPLYWITVNQFLHDDAAAFKINFYRKFEPSCLGSPEETRKFMDANKDVIHEASESVLKDIRSTPKGSKIVVSHDHNTLQKNLKEQFEGLNPHSKRNLLGLAEQLGMSEKGNPDQLIEFIAKLYESGVLDKNKIEKIQRTWKK